jgi:hypothetical protein
MRSPNANAISSDYIIGISGLEGLTQIVVPLDLERIPVYIVEILRDFFNERKAFFELLSRPRGQSRRDLRANDDGHFHIIQILENNLTIIDKGVKQQGSLRRKLPCHAKLFPWTSQCFRAIRY